MNQADQFLVLRGLACLAVVVCHSWQSIPLLHTALMWQGYNVSWLLSANGSVAVQIFFTLSGYLMGKQFYSGKYQLNIPDILHFWRSRCLRIMPLYYFLVILFAVFLYTDILALKNIKSFFKLLTFSYHFASPERLFSIPFWSIATEMKFYLIVPFLALLLMPRLKKLWVIVIGLLLVLGGIETYKLWRFQQAFAGSFVLLKYIKHFLTPLSMNLDSFLIGFWVNPLVVKWNERVPSTSSIGKAITGFFQCRYMCLTVGWLAMTGLHLLSAYWVAVQPFSPVYIIGFPLMAGAITALFIFLCEASAVQGATSPLNVQSIQQNPWRLLELIGILSYGIYLWHSPLSERLYGLTNEVNPILRFIHLIGLVLGFSLLLSGLTYRFIEKPFNELRYRIPKHQDSANQDLAKRNVIYESGHYA